MNDSVADVKQVKTAILLLAHGAPNSVDDIPLYLKNIRGGTESSAEVIQIIQDRYNAIGGSSPLLEITQAQASALQDYLNQADESFKVYVGMRNWSPYIESAIAECMKDGAERIITICLAPQYSKWSTERYLSSFNDALAKCSGTNIETRRISSWADHPGLIDAFVERYNAAIEREKSNGKNEIHTIFTAHSIPAESLDYGDPYAKEYQKTVQEIVDRVKPDNWYSAYQSQGMIPIPWLGPTVEETLDTIADSGGKNILIMPVGFVCDHIEILFDIDIEFKEYAQKKNLDLSRTESLNTSPTFIRALAEVIWGHMI
jgi:ferrochelatase